jgi:hypothetical protein
MMRFYSHSEPSGHADNEDVFEVRRHPDEPLYLLAAIADGQGGQPGGQEAACLACRTCLDAAAAIPPIRLFKPSSWTGLLEQADHAVAADPVAGFTTLIGFCIALEQVCGGSCGDSAVVLVDPDSRGYPLTASQYKNPPVGSGGANIVPFGSVLERPWVVLAMTDGVWKYAGWDRTHQIASEERDEAVITRLLDCVRLPRSGGLQDDFTLLALFGT